MKIICVNENSDKRLFIGYPIITDTSTLALYNLTINDLPQHDSLVEYLFLYEGMKRSMSEAEKYATNLKNSNKLLLDKEALLREAMGISKMGTWELNYNESTALFSSGCCDIYGFDANDNRHSFDEWLSMIHQEDLEYAKAEIKKAEQSLQPVSFIIRIKAKDGTEKYVSQKTIFKFSKDGVPIGLFGIVQNITVQKTSELKILNNEQRLNALLENNKEVIVVTDESRSIHYITSAVENILGYAVKDLIGSKSIHLYHPEDAQQVNIALKEIINEGLGAYRQLEVRMLSKDQGYKWLELAATNQLENPAIRGIVTNLHDITLLKDAQKKIEKANQELEIKVMERTNELRIKNDDLESFVYTVSHDLRSPLRLINSFATLLIEADGFKENPDRMKEILNIISTYTLRMNDIISDLLNLSRLNSQELNKQSVDLNALIGIVVNEIKSDSKYNNSAVLIGEIPPILADPGLIRQALENLISNAFKYSAKVNNPEIKIDATTVEGQATLFSISDNGAGFDPSFARRLFKPFQRGHSSVEFEGTGIGLSIVKSIIEKHGGNIWADSIPNIRTTFYFTLP
jgi:PAS domain S-box-containing protein